ncbi:MAG: hypothetical protein KJN89_02985 [Gammaproteobacteria bacterium]|nr:hypothetical protein [Gammaproteobacteria bacterium]NNJ49314.1 hypothetical protein [Gammaproteobacteria bacterium]
MSDLKKSTPAKLPLWVLLAFSSIEKRKHAILLIWVCVFFTLYCLPWANFTSNKIVTSFFVIDDWSWLAMMIPICLWYLLSLRWMDKNNAWG